MSDASSASSASGASGASGKAGESGAASSEDSDDSDFDDSDSNDSGSDDSDSDDCLDAEDAELKKQQTAVRKQLAQLKKKRALKNSNKRKRKMKPIFDDLVNNLTTSRNFTRCSGSWNKACKKLGGKDGVQFWDAVKATITTVKAIELATTKARDHARKKLVGLASVYYNYDYEQYVKDAKNAQKAKRAKGAKRAKTK
tara:strand:+ start:85 stop:678 length:594 start_codon:yes stop_codon:yes gene_type:complete